MTEDPPASAAIITGASRGLGATIAGWLASEGFRLVVTGRRPGPLAEAAARYRAFGGAVSAVPGDVADPAHRAQIRRRLDELGAPLRLLVNNASELGPSPLRALADTVPEDLERVYRTNVVAPLALVRELLPELTTGHATIVNVSSDAALGGYPGWGAYGASKAALDLASRTLANELRDRGIAVVSVDPGDLRTAMHQAAYPGEDIGDRPLPEVTLPFWAWLLQQDPMRISGLRFRAEADRWELPA